MSQSNRKVWPEYSVKILETNAEVEISTSFRILRDGKYYLIPINYVAGSIVQGGSSEASIKMAIPKINNSCEDFKRKYIIDPAKDVLDYDQTDKIL